MKKTKYYAWMMAAALAMTGCSDEMEGPGGEGTTIENGVLDGYIKVSLNLPTTSGLSTRTEQNDQFDNGKPEEYNVGQDNYIIFFEKTTGAEESTATYRGIYKLKGLNFGNANTDDSPNITTTSTVIQEAPKLTSESNEMYALVILNANGIVSTGADNSLLIKGESVTSPTLSSFYQVLNGTGTDSKDYSAIGTYIGASKNSFLMLNAPIASVSGAASQENQSVSTLAKITVYEHENDATQATPDPIYVERAVAKVTISEFPETLQPQGTADTNPLTGAAISLEHWTLDNTNKSTKLLRDVTGTNASTEGWDYWSVLANTTTTISSCRFFGTVELPYRVYWAIDDNYTASSTNATEDFNSIPAGSVADDTWNDEKTDIAYCLENTFDLGENNSGVVGSGLQKNATRVLFQVKVTPNITEEGKAIPDGDNSSIPATNFFLPKERSLVYTKTTLLAEIAEHFTPEGEEGVAFALSDNLSAASYKDAASLYEGENPLFKSGVNGTNAADILNHFGGEILFYKNDIMYYSAVYIKHFGDYYTPLDATQPTGANFLGRYGVVRNNWYDIAVKKVGIGAPTIPDDEGDLDEDEAYINAEINILSWAKRSQNVELH